MERTQLFDLMGELKLYGMKDAFDEIMATAIKRQHEPQRIIGDLLNAEINEKQARSINYQLTIAKLPLAKDLDDFEFEGTPINETLVNDLAGGGFVAQQRNVSPINSLEWTSSSSTNSAICPSPNPAASSYSTLLAGSTRRPILPSLLPEAASAPVQETDRREARSIVAGNFGGCHGYGNDICAATGCRTQRPVAQGSHRIDGRHRDRVVRLFPLWHRGRSHLRQTLLPNQEPLAATLAAFGTYFVGFAARPVGAAIFGHYGDRIGRKATLIATLLFMGIATFLVAFVPTYASIGIWGAVILTALRALQGIGVGGEWGGSVLLAMEWSRTHGQRGLVASWPQFGVPCGLLLSTGGPRFQRMVGRSVHGLGLAHSLRTFDHSCRHRFVDSPRHPRDAGVPTALGHEQDREGPDLRSRQEAA